MTKTNKQQIEYLKLVRWFNDKMPPIDLNANVHHVIKLISEIKELRYKNDVLEQKLSAQGRGRRETIIS